MQKIEAAQDVFFAQKLVIRYTRFLASSAKCNPDSLIPETVVQMQPIREDYGMYSINRPYHKLLDPAEIRSPCQRARPITGSEIAKHLNIQLLNSLGVVKEFIQFRNILLRRIQCIP